MKENITIQSISDFKDIGEAKPQKPRSELTKKVVEYTIDGVFVAAYDSVQDARRATGLPTETVGGVCRGTYLHTSERNGNRIFLYRGEDIAERIQKIQAKQSTRKKYKPPKEVYEYTLGGRLLCIYSTAKEAAIANQIYSHHILKCCKGKKLFVNKRIFLYPEGDIKQRVKEVKAELYRLSKKRPRYREVDEYSLEGEIIKAYPSASAAARAYNTYASTITGCCNGNRPDGDIIYTSHGRIFLWVGDSISDRLEQIKTLKNRRKKYVIKSSTRSK